MIHPVRGRGVFAAFGRASTGRSGPVRVRFLQPTVSSSADHAHTSVAYAVGRKVGNAVTRNRIRRRLRSAVAELQRRGSLPPGTYLLATDFEAATCTFNELVAWVEDAVNRAVGRARPEPVRTPV